MSDFYVKSKDGQFIPLTLDFFPFKNKDSLMIITVGNDKELATNELIEYVYKTIRASDLFSDLMRNSNNNLLLLPNSIKAEILSKRELENKTICISLNKNDDLSNFPELLTKSFKDLGVKIIPSPITLKEYQEVKQVQKRIDLKKRRSGGGLNQP